MDTVGIAEAASLPRAGFHHDPPGYDDVCLYRDGWLFHGPLYQGIASIDAFGSNGIHGHLKSLPAKGALLDNVGQLFGLWISQTHRESRLNNTVVPSAPA